jgi:hypothetical protein
MGILLLGSSTGSPTDPVENDPLYSLGADDFTHRWAAERLSGAAGTVVTSWPDAGSSPAPLAVSGSSVFTVATDTGEKVVQNSAAAGKLQSGVGGSGAGTMVALVKAPTAGPILANGLGVNLYRAGSGQYGVTIDGGGYNVAGGVDGVWAIVMWATNGAAKPATGDYVLSVNGTEVTTLASYGSGPTPDPALTLAFNAQADPAAPSSFAELVHWNRFLTAAERAGVIAAMKARYAFI